MVTPRPRLESWKEIAEYVGRDVRTVMRWERDRALPVHRLPGGRGSTVFALPEEIDAWLHVGDSRVTPPPGAPRALPRSRSITRLWIALGTSTAVLTGWVALVVPTRLASAEVGSVSFTGQRIVAAADGGSTLWTHDFGRPLGSIDLGRAVTIVDLDGDGRKEVVVAVAFDDRTGGGSAGDVLFCFSPAGAVQWQIEVTDRVTFSGGTFGPPWVGSFVLSYGTPSRPAIAWAVHHYTWWPAAVLRITPDGRVTHRFLHPGWLTTLSASADGSRLFASGVSNASNANVTAVLDGLAFGGAPPAPPDCEYACVGCAPEGLMRYLVFPRSEVSLAAPFPMQPTVARVKPDGGLEVHVLQAQGPPEFGEALYELDGDLNVTRGAYSDSYWRWHARLQAAGRLSHAADQCPQPTPPAPRVWRPGDGS